MLEELSFRSWLKRSTPQELKKEEGSSVSRRGRLLAKHVDINKTSEQEFSKVLNDFKNWYIQEAAKDKSVHVLAPFILIFFFTMSLLMTLMMGPVFLAWLSVSIAFVFAWFKWINS